MVVLKTYIVEFIDSSEKDNLALLFECENNTYYISYSYGSFNSKKLKKLDINIAKMLIEL